MAFTILAIVAVATTQLLLTSLGAVRDSRYQLAASNIATQALEKLSGQHFSADAAMVTAPPPPTTQTVQGTPYTLSLAAEWVSRGSTSSSCTSSSGTVGELVRVVASVTYPGLVGPPVVQSTTFTPPTGTYSVNSGNLGVDVIGASAKAVQGVTVTATDTSTKASTSIVTPPDGCAFFAYLPADPYTVTVSAPGWVDPNGNPSPSQSVTVLVSATTTAEFQYDQGATLSLTPAASTPVASGMSLTIENANLAPSYPTAPVSVSGATTVPALFPYTDGYRVYAGTCSYADPQGQSSGQPIYSGATAGSPAVQAPSLTPAPGGQAQAALPLGTLAVQVSGPKGSPVQGATVVASSVNPSPCPTATYHLSPTGATGSSDTALAYGQYQVTVTSGRNSSTFGVWVTPGGDVAESTSSTGSAPASPTFVPTFAVTL